MMYTVKEKATAVLLHASYFSQWQTAEKLHCHYPNIPWPGQGSVGQIFKDYRTLRVFQTNQQHVPRRLQLMMIAGCFHLSRWQ